MRSHCNGVIDAQLEALLVANSRTPDLLLGDLSSQWSATSLGGRELQALATREGRNFGALCDALIAQAEALTRQQLLACPAAPRPGGYASGGAACGERVCQYVW